VQHVPVPSESAAGSSFYKLIDLGRAFYCFALISARTMVELVFAASTSFVEVDAESCRYVVRDQLPDLPEGALSMDFTTFKMAYSRK
jgi:hypothetical protein